MREDITSIPVTDVFDEHDGCPICRMRDLLETRVTDYITGAAMMEPDVRQETNDRGFCLTHYRQLLKKRARLPVALMMESRLAEVEKQVFAGVPLFGKSAKKQASGAEKVLSSCFVCERVDWAMTRLLATVCRLWENERDFRDSFEQQEHLCLPHFELLVQVASQTMNKKNVGDFAKASSTLCRKYLEELRGDVSHFCKMFDYRNSSDENADWGNSRDSIERSVAWLCGREP
ncbi:MAG: hypothetical protein IJD01_04350 [Clostridia bacterium]|nr:hypothetical protein [Clostridia bacterium]